MKESNCGALLVTDQHVVSLMSLVAILRGYSGITKIRDL